MDLYEAIMQSAGRQMDKAAIETTNALKETLSEPVPRLVNKNVKIPGQRKGQKRTFVKEGQNFRLVTKGHLYRLNSGVFQVPTHENDFVIYTTSTGKQVFVVKATRGAPPRKFEGRLRAGHTWERADDSRGIVRRVGTNVLYAREHEEGVHPYFAMTILRIKPRLEQLMGTNL